VGDFASGCWRLATTECLFSKIKAKRYMLQFERKFIGDILIAETNSVLEKCKLYEIFDGQEMLGRFYSGENYCFADCANWKIRFEAEKHFFKKSIYRIIEQNTGQVLDEMNIPNSSPFIEIDNAFILANGESFAWTKSMKDYAIFKKSTWNRYRFNLFSEADYFVFNGVMEPNNQAEYLNPDQVFKGEIHSKVGVKILPILAGIYLMEESFRRIEDRF
jgi:hypothetical protein